MVFFLHFSVHSIFEFPLYISSYIIKKIHTIFSFLGRITYYFQIYPRANTNYDTFYVLQRALAPFDFFLKYSNRVLDQKIHIMILTYYYIPIVPA